MFNGATNFNNGYAAGNTSNPLNWVIKSGVAIPISGMSRTSSLTPVSPSTTGNATTVNAVGFVGTLKVICYNNI
jgi:hypothetical protein